MNSSQGVRIKGITTVECDACATSKAKRQIQRYPQEILEGLGKQIAIDFYNFKEDEGKFKSIMLFTNRWLGHI